MQDLPTSAQLLAAIARTLTTNVVPASSGAVAHEARVAANLCAILAREAELGADFETQARSLLADLVGGPDDSDASPAVLNDRLYDTIMREGDDDRSALSTATTDALGTIVANKLAVAKPGYDAYDFAAERALADAPEGPDA